jgi:hypothetical protein
VILYLPAGLLLLFKRADNFRFVKADRNSHRTSPSEDGPGSSRRISRSLSSALRRIPDNSCLSACDTFHNLGTYRIPL